MWRRWLTWGAAVSTEQSLNCCQNLQRRRMSLTACREFSYPHWACFRSAWTSYSHLVPSRSAGPAERRQLQWHCNTLIIWFYFNHCHNSYSQRVDFTLTLSAWIALERVWPSPLWLMRLLTSRPIINFCPDDKLSLQSLPVTKGKVQIYTLRLLNNVCYMSLSIVSILYMHTY